MAIQKILFILLFVPSIIFGMEPGAKRPKFNGDVIQQNPFLSALVLCINNLDVNGLNNLLQNSSVKRITSGQREYLCSLAEENASQLIDQCNMNRAMFRKKKGSVTPFDEHLKKARQIKTLTYAITFFSDFKFPQSFFGPRPKMRDSRPSLDKILEVLIMNEKMKISACCFHLTLYNLAECMVDRKNDNVKVVLVTNRQQGDAAPLEALSLLIENDIPVYAPCTDAFETNHHKFIIFSSNISGKSLVWTGSYNPTGHSNENSWEDVVILDDVDSIFAYYDRFKEIKDASDKMELSDFTSNQKKQPSFYSLRSNNVPLKKN